ncbi:MAG: hypothetical protein COA84_15000 [Robiginitomaculum sp.]|nr:MAG: hypothetical protein COA84_15000 [Robiginitomaculum sp.]
MIGDELVIIGKSLSDSQVCEVYDILDVNDKEEIIINNDENKYFITEMYLDGKSWAEDVFIVDRKLDKPEFFNLNP